MFFTSIKETLVQWRGQDLGHLKNKVWDRGVFSPQQWRDLRWGLCFFDENFVIVVWNIINKV